MILTHLETVGRTRGRINNAAHTLFTVSELHVLETLQIKRWPTLFIQRRWGAKYKYNHVLWIIFLTVVNSRVTANTSSVWVPEHTVYFHNVQECAVMHINMPSLLTDMLIWFIHIVEDKMSQCLRTCCMHDIILYVSILYSFMVYHSWRLTFSHSLTMHIRSCMSLLCVFLARDSHWYRISTRVKAFHCMRATSQQHQSIIVYSDWLPMAWFSIILQRFWTWKEWWYTGRNLSNV